MDNSINNRYLKLVRFFTLSLSACQTQKRVSSDNVALPGIVMLEMGRATLLQPNLMFVEVHRLNIDFLSVIKILGSVIKIFGLISFKNVSTM